MVKSERKTKTSKRPKKSRMRKTRVRDRVKRRIPSLGLDNQKKSHLVKVFLEMINVVKIYHWKTRSFSQHSATDELYGRLNEHVDKFVEVLLGKDQSRINMVERTIDLLDASTTSEFQERIFEYRRFLTDLDRYFVKGRDTDILNIRDEILADINQFLYLLTFDK